MLIVAFTVMHPRVIHMPTFWALTIELKFHHTCPVAFEISASCKNSLPSAERPRKDLVAVWLGTRQQIHCSSEAVPAGSVACCTRLIICSFPYGFPPVCQNSTDPAKILAGIWDMHLVFSCRAQSRHLEAYRRF